jgi:hypothetical protein
VIALVTRDRMRSYLADCSGSEKDAVKLYHWNMAAARSILGLAALVEIALRNLMDQQLLGWAKARRAGASWLDAVNLDQQGADDLRKARWRATRRGTVPEVHGKVVAELSFGFWRFLVARRYYTQLWIPALSKAFPGAPGSDPEQRRLCVESAMEDLVFVRNRAAHHEPIHRRDLLRDLVKARSLCHWADQNAALWVITQSTVASVVDSKP